MKRLFLVLALTCVAMLVATAAWAAKPKAAKDLSECGTILTEPGNYKLVNDLLDCPGHGVEIQGSEIALNLNGYEITCADNNLEVAGVGVWSPTDSTIRNVTIKNGRISNCRDGIVLIQTEDSKVMHITSTGNTKWEPVPDVFEYGTGITLWMSHGNKIMHNTTFGNEGEGIGLWASGGNVIMHNHAYGNAADGMGSWWGGGNLFKHNTSTDNGNSWFGTGINLSYELDSIIMCNRVHGNADGILLWDGSSGNLLRGNLATGNQNSGIGTIGYYWQNPDKPEQNPYVAMPSDNTIMSNIAEGHPWVDLFEAYWDFGDNLLLNPDGICRNTWQMNQFGTEIGVPGCIGTPVMLDEKDVCALDDDD